MLPILDSPFRIAAFARRNDLSGFVVVNAFAAWRAASNTGPYHGWSASDEALMMAAERQILAVTAVEGMEADPTLATPQTTWTTFLVALRAGNREMLRKCLAPTIRAKWESLLQIWPRADRVKVARQMNDLTDLRDFGDTVFAVAAKPYQGTSRVKFVKIGSNWIIAET